MVESGVCFGMFRVEGETVSLMKMVYVPLK